MRRIPTARARVLSVLTLLLTSAACGGGGGDGGTEPPTVASVAITAPAAPPSFQTLTRTVQFSAVARDAAAAAVAGATITWNSSNTGVATVSGTGLVTAVGNGTTNITASSSGITSPAVVVTVAQVVNTVTATPAAVAFGAIGATRQLAAAAVDSSGAPVAGAAAATWTRVGPGTVASVSAGGLATALAVGVGDTAVATIGARTARVPITVTQVVASILVNSTGSDTLKTTGRTKTYTAVVRDSQLNTMAGTAVTWSSNQTAVATVSGAGVATAVADGNSNITATAGGVNGVRALTVRRYADTFTLTPGSGNITTPLGTNILLGLARDSVNTNLPISWTSRTTTVITVNPATGTQTTATAAGNGATYVVMSAGTRNDSTLITVTGQPTAPLTAGVGVGIGNIFTSTQNGTVNPAVDTIGVGGTVTWTFNGGIHSVQSQGSPSFTSSANQGNGTYAFTFNAVGTYLYNCSVHGDLMTGRVVVR